MSKVIARGIFNERMLHDQNLPVVSPGIQKRNFTHIDDIVNGLILVGDSGYGDEFGIGSPDAYSIIDVAKMFGGKIDMLPERPGNRMTADVITEKTISLGWEPKFSIKKYIK